MSVSGASCMFGLHSNDIKSSLGYDQTALNLISFFKNLGGNVVVLIGLDLRGCAAMDCYIIRFDHELFLAFLLSG